MSNLLIAAAATILSGCAAVAGSGDESATSDTHYWLHPKLGMVKVDARTHAMVQPGSRAQAPTAPQQTGTVR